MLPWLFHAAHVALGHRPPFVLCYHGVGTVERGRDRAGLFIGRGLFAQHLDVIRSRRYRLATVAELWHAIAGGAAPGAAGLGASAVGLGAITFDDALARTAHEALPELQARGMPCTIFVPTALMGRRHPDVEGERILDGRELVELAGAGVEIGAHSVDHVWLPGLPYATALDQMRRSRAVLEDLLGKPVRSMAYPYGGVDEQTMRAAAEAGFEVACACSGPGAWNALSLPRSPVFASTTRLRLRLKMAGLYGPVHRLVADDGPIGRHRAAAQRRAGFTHGGERPACPHEQTT